MREQEGIRLFMILKNNKSQCDKKIALVMIVSEPHLTPGHGLTQVLLLSCSAYHMVTWSVVNNNVLSDVW